MGTDVSGLHHVGHLVNDMGRAIDRYRRFGFTLPGPSYPALGTPPEVFGVGNTHVSFASGFVELVAVSGRVPDDARLIPLRAPEDRLPHLKEAIRVTAANLADCLRRFEGVHILIADSADVATTAERLTASGVGHQGVLATQRPVETAEGTRMEPVRFLEIDGTARGRVPEGRVGFAENTADQAPGSPAPQGVEHPNGAVELVGCVLCVADDDLPAAEERYERYLGRPALGERAVRTFDLGEGPARLTLVAASALGGLLPGERPPVLPGFVAYAVAVRDLARTRRYLREAGVRVGETPSGETFVPAGAAFGAAIVFRQAV